MAESTERLKELLVAFRNETAANSISPDRLGYILQLMLQETSNPDSEKFLRKDVRDEAKDVIAFLAGLVAGDYIKGQSGASISEVGDAELNSLLVRCEAVFGDNLSSEKFVSGFFSGLGWAITKDKNGKFTLEIDNVIVRNALRVFEMIVSQLVGENDNRVFTSCLKVDHYDPETGTVYLDTEGGTFYNPFRKDDIVEVQRYNGLPSEENDYYVTKNYMFYVTEVGVGNLADGENRLDWLRFESFYTTMEGLTPEDLIVKGDTLVRMDNLTDEERKGIIQIMAVGSKTPYLDVLYGIKTDPDNALKARLGNLQGIRHPLFGWLKEWGAYIINLYAVGDFRLRRTGDSLDTQIEFLKLQFSSMYSQVTYEVSEEDNLLYNPSFSENMKGWTSQSLSKLITLNGEPSLMNGNFYSTLDDCAQLKTYDGRKMLFISNSGIRQDNSLITKPETHKVYEYEPKTPATWQDQVYNNLQDKNTTQKNILYLAMKFLPVTDGLLTIGFRGASSDTDSLPNPAVVSVSKSEDWITLTWQGTWDGKGDFVLEYTGQLYVQALSLTTDPLSDFKKEIGTQILQTNENIKLIGYNVDLKASRMTSLGIEINAVDERIDAYVKTTDEALGRIEGTQLTLTSNLAELKAYAEYNFTDPEGFLNKKIEQAGISIMADVARIYATSESVNTITGQIKQSVANIEVRAGQIESSVVELENGLAKANSSITQTARDIRLEVTDIEAGLQSQITQNATNISLKVSKGNVINEINLDQSGAVIKAENISLLGYTTINKTFIIDEDGNVTVGGDLIADSFSYRVATNELGDSDVLNGSILTNSIGLNNLRLPDLEVGSAKVIMVLMPARTSGMDISISVFDTSNDSIIIYAGGLMSMVKKITLLHDTFYAFQFIGVKDTYTNSNKWHIVRFVDASGGFAIG